MFEKYVDFSLKICLVCFNVFKGYIVVESQNVHLENNDFRFFSCGIRKHKYQIRTNLGHFCANGF